MAEVNRVRGLFQEAARRARGMRPAAAGVRGVLDSGGSPEQVAQRLSAGGAVATRVSLEAAFAARVTEPVSGSSDPFREELSDKLGLDAVAYWLLLMALAPAVSHEIARLCAVARHDPDRPWTSGGVVVEALGIDLLEGAQTLLAHLRPPSPLVELRLLDVGTSGEGALSLQDDVRPSGRLLDFALGVRSLPKELAAGCQLVEARSVEEPILDSQTAQCLEAASAQTREALEANVPTMIPVLVLVGPEGTGRGTIAARVARSLGRPLLRAHCGQLERMSGGSRGSQKDDATVGLRRVVREARLQKALLYLEGIEDLEPSLAFETARLLDRWLDAFVLGGTSAAPQRLTTALDRPTVPISIPMPGAELRRKLWDRYLPRRLMPNPVERDAVAHRYKVTGEQIRRAGASCIEATRRAGVATVTPEALDAAVRSNTTHTLDTVARRIAFCESWNDLVVPAETALLLRSIVAQFRHRRRVFEEWGFAQRFGRGLGLSTLFSGPPGTGKTMAAGIIATELGLSLYQVEISQVVSKWVGETEKNMDQIFRQAEAAAAVILFDEADSLFANRTDVSSASDRYANLEVNHLLQHIESFEGVAILTTNKPATIDDAFRRRFAYHVEFVVPDIDARLLLWEKLIPEDAPLAPDISFTALARDYEFSGGHIKNAVIRAAYFAAELGKPIDERTLRLTADLELKQLGRVVRNLDVEQVWQDLRTVAEQTQPS